MTATYTFDVYSTVDGFGSYGPGGDWGGYWGKQGPELLAHRAEIYRQEQRMVLGATTFRDFLHLLPDDLDPETDEDPLPGLMRAMPTTVVSSTLQGPFRCPDATVLTGDAVEVVRRLKEESPVPLRSHGSLALNRALLAAGLVDVVQLTIFPVVSGRTGTDPVLAGAEDLDLEMISSRLLDGRTQELLYRPTLHRR